MALQIQSTFELSSIIAAGTATSATQQAAFAFQPAAKNYAVQFDGTWVSGTTCPITAKLQHSPDSSNWYDLVSCSLVSGTTQAVAFEDQTKQPKPLLPFGRTHLSLANSGGTTAQFKDLVVKILADR